jgi:hypothetical protein
MAKETIGIEEAVRLTLVERGDIPPLELVALLAAVRLEAT